MGWAAIQQKTSWTHYRRRTAWTLLLYSLQFNTIHNANAFLVGSSPNSGVSDGTTVIVNGRLEFLMERVKFLWATLTPKKRQLQPMTKKPRHCVGLSQLWISLTEPPRSLQQRLCAAPKLTEICQRLQRRLLQVRIWLVLRFAISTSSVLCDPHRKKCRISFFLSWIDLTGSR